MTFQALTRNDRILLYVSAAGASCALYRNSTLKEVRSLSCDEEGWEEFNALLLKHPGKPVAIAVDTVDEIYRQDILPRVHGPDRHEMTDRRLRQLIHHSAYRAALRQKSALAPELRDQLKARRQDRYLMMGLTNAEIIRPWLDIMHVRGAHLAGIWLLPALAIPLARLFRLGSSRLLLVSEQTGGLRLTYLEDGELRFSRLAPVDSNQYSNPLEGYAEEIERTRQSLVGQRLMARSEPLRTLLLDPLNSLSELHELLPESAGFQCESILRGQLLDTLHLPPSLLAESSDALYLKLLSDAPQSANMMTRDQHADTRVHWMKRGMLFIAAVWLGLAGIGSTLLWLDTWRLQVAAANADAASLRNQAAEARLLAGAGGAAVIEQRRLRVEAWQKVGRLDQEPSPIFEQVQKISHEIGNVRIQRLAWSTNSSLPPGSGRDQRATIHIDGEITPFDNDFSAAHQHLRQLAERLQADLPVHHVEISRWPLDNQADNELEGAFGHNLVSARFQIEITAAAP